MSPDNIITFMYDDIADNVSNPYPGQIFNNPEGPNVYEGIRIDYRGRDVTP
jgi:legumain